MTLSLLYVHTMSHVLEHKTTEKVSSDVERVKSLLSRRRHLLYEIIKVF